MQKKTRVQQDLRARTAAGLVFCSFAFAACGGSAFDGGTGDASVGGGVAATGGHASGGAVGVGGRQGLGGHPGAGGSAGSPSATGGAPSTCTSNSDCTACAYTTAPANSSQCYCANCAITPMTKTQCEANQSAWKDNCSNVPMACPAIACVMPSPVACVGGLCGVAAGGTTN